MDFTDLGVRACCAVCAQCAICHLAGIKCQVAELYNSMQTGGGEPTGLTDIEHMTGLSRPTVIATLDGLLAGQVLERQAEGRSFIYMPVVKFLNRSETQLVKKFYYFGNCEPAACI
jgi:hypothetical protein